MTKTEKLLKALLEEVHDSFEAAEEELSHEIKSIVRQNQLKLNFIQRRMIKVGQTIALTFNGKMRVGQVMDINPHTIAVRDARDGRTFYPWSELQSNLTDILLLADEPMMVGGIVSAASLNSDSIQMLSYPQKSGKNSAIPHGVVPVPNKNGEIHTSEKPRRTITIDLETGEWVSKGVTLQEGDAVRVANSVLPGWPEKEIHAAYGEWMMNDSPVPRTVGSIIEIDAIEGITYHTPKTAYLEKSGKYFAPHFYGKDDGEHFHPSRITKHRTVKDAGEDA